jgi:hypothetical protein
MIANPSTLAELASLLDRASAASEIFGSDPTGEYRRLAKLCHPDRFPNESERAAAHKIFIRLTTCFEQAKAAAIPHVLCSALRPCTLRRRIAVGDLADVFLAVSDRTEYVLKICRPNKGNPLLAAEHRCLTMLARRSGDRRYREYFPNPVDTFVASDEYGGRQVNIFVRREGFTTLESIHERYPAGLDPRHLAWLFKRMLTVAGFAHECGVVHGAILPPHVMVHAENHGLQLVDWIHAVKVGQRLSFVPGLFHDWYPLEVLNKEPVTPATDIFLAAKCLLYAAGGDPLAERWPDSVPSTMRQFVNTCLYASPRMRPQNAWHLHEEFDELLRRLFGPPTYHRLVMN